MMMMEQQVKISYFPENTVFLLSGQTNWFRAHRIQVGDLPGLVHIAYADLVYLVHLTHTLNLAV